MLTVSNLTKSYGKKTVLSSINFSVDDASCVGISGLNGSGKTTLLSILAGILQADSGTVFWDNHNLLEEKKFRSEISGYVPQSLTLFEELSARDNLKLWVSKSNIKNINEKLNSGSLKFLSVLDFIDVKVSKLSGGMKKRLSIACAVIENPTLLILDEPSSALDSLCKEQIKNYICEFKKEGGSVILVSHDKDEMEVCDKIFTLSDGVLK